MSTKIPRTRNLARVLSLFVLFICTVCSNLPALAQYSKTRFAIDTSGTHMLRSVTQESVRWRYKPEKPFVASYELTDSGTKGTVQVFSDALGHLRVETGFYGGKTTDIVDMGSGAIYHLDDKQKYAFKSDSRWPDLGLTTFFVEAFGIPPPIAKTIDGRSCHGSSTVCTEEWYDDDMGCAVLLKHSTGTLRLKSCRVWRPVPSLVQIPPGYKKIDDNTELR